jgi:HAD superfamily hydrolase (TIGR01509 family)
MIRALIFDCFGVLYRPSAQTLMDLVPMSEQERVRDITRACDHGIISRGDYFEQIAELLGKSPDDIRAIDRNEHVRNDQLIEYIKLLKKEYKIGLLSNIGDETMDELFPENERHDLFDAFVLSSNIGLIKPAIEVFEYTAAQLGMPADECVMIDDLLKNVDGAERAGMRGIVFTSNRQLELDLGSLLGTKHA